MKYTILLTIFLSVMFSCGQTSTKNFSSNKTDTVEVKISQAPKDTISNLLSPSDCVRATPEPVVKKEIFSKTTFQLQSDSLTAFETVDFDNGDKLIITNSGCEYFVLIFRFETSRFDGDTTNTAYWFDKSLILTKEISKGIDAPVQMDKGIKALKKYIDSTKNPEFGKQIDYGLNEIRYFVTVDRVEKIEDKKFAIELTFAIGPL